MRVDIKTDTDGFSEWLSATKGPIDVDTETTGLDIFSPNYQVRLIKFGDRDTAYVLDPRKHRK